MICRTQVPIGAGRRLAFEDNFCFFISSLRISFLEIGNSPLRAASRWIRRIVFAIAILAALAISCRPIQASVGGSISGTVSDASGSVVANASITLREVDTGLLYRARTDGKGEYMFPVLSVGRYELDIAALGFRGYQRKGIVLDTNAALALDATLAVGDVAETVHVTDNTMHVETSSTQMGEAISGRQMTAVPLNGRSYTDLLSLQPGVAPATSITSSTVQDVGATILDPSGTLNPGTISVNGQRESANYFSVNGADSEEGVNGGSAIVPNLDAIAEFRILTGNFDAEYGEFSGGQINVITKSGSNKFHGDAFEFLRNTDLDARNYFLPLVAHSGKTSSAARWAGRCGMTKSFSSSTIKGRGRRRESIPASSAFRRTQIAWEIWLTLPAT